MDILVAEAEPGQAVDVLCAIIVDNQIQAERNREGCVLIPLTELTVAFNSQRLPADPVLSEVDVKRIMEGLQ